MAIDKRMLARSSPAGLAWWHSGAKWSDDRSEWSWIPAQHLLLLSERIVDVATGRCPRLIVTMPPRHGKSELISRYSPAWFLGNFPDKKVMLASYADTFAASWGRKARDVLKDEAGLFGVKINSETSGGMYWELVGRNGVMVTAGVGGGLTGKGAHLMIIDDPVKNAEEAQSEKVRDAHWDWWLSTARTRLQKGAGAILVMTRWHEDDLAGRMLANDPLRHPNGELLPEGVTRMDLGFEEVEGDHWEVLNLPAFAEPLSGEEPTLEDGSPDTEWRDEVGRAFGDVLWPEMFDASWMEQTQRAQGLYWFSAMYQQRPAPASGMTFKRDNFRYFEQTGVTVDGSALVTMYPLEREPYLLDVAYCTKFQTVDVAATEKQSSDYTVVSTWLVTPTRDLILWDVQRAKFDATKVGTFVENCIVQHKPSIVGVERLGHGLAVVQELTNKGYPIRRLEPDQDKMARALPAIARYEEHRVYHPRNAPWLGEFEKELLVFPNGAHDDQVDTVAYAALELPRLGGNGMPRSAVDSEKRPERAPARRRRRGHTETGGLMGRQL